MAGEQIIGKKHPRDEEEEGNIKDQKENSPTPISTISCLLCLETNESSSKILSSHQCPQCKFNSWSICEQCEESLFSKMCPICRGDYAPLKYYGFHDEINDPSLSSPQLLSQSARSHAINLAKISLIQYEKVGVWCPASSPPLIHFSFPQDLSKPPKEMEFLHVSLPITAPNELLRLSDPLSKDPIFLFTNSTWDRLDEILEGTLAAAGSGNDDSTVETVNEDAQTTSREPDTRIDSSQENSPPPSSSLVSFPVPVNGFTSPATPEGGQPGEEVEAPTREATPGAEEGDGDENHILGIKETLQRVISLLAEEGAVFITPLNPNETRELIEAYLS
jgi:hypothetical protein